MKYFVIFYLIINYTFVLSSTEFTKEDTLELQKFLIEYTECYLKHDSISDYMDVDEYFYYNDMHCLDDFNRKIQGSKKLQKLLDIIKVDNKSGLECLHKLIIDNAFYGNIGNRFYKVEKIKLQELTIRLRSCKLSNNNIDTDLKRIYKLNNIYTKIDSIIHYHYHTIFIKDSLKVKDILVPVKEKHKKYYVEYFAMKIYDNLSESTLLESVENDSVHKYYLNELLLNGYYGYVNFIRALSRYYLSNNNNKLNYRTIRNLMWDELYKEINYSTLDTIEGKYVPKNLEDFFSYISSKIDSNKIMKIIDRYEKEYQYDSFILLLDELEIYMPPRSIYRNRFQAYLKKMGINYEQDYYIADLIYYYYKGRKDKIINQLPHYRTGKRE
jgi:hypothetical protein